MRNVEEQKGKVVLRRRRMNRKCKSVLNDGEWWSVEWCVCVWHRSGEEHWMMMKMSAFFFALDNCDFHSEFTFGHVKCGFDARYSKMRSLWYRPNGRYVKSGHRNDRLWNPQRFRVNVLLCDGIDDSGQHYLEKLKSLDWLWSRTWSVESHACAVTSGGGSSCHRSWIRAKLTRMITWRHVDNAKSEHELLEIANELLSFEHSENSFDRMKEMHDVETRVKTWERARVVLKVERTIPTRCDDVMNCETLIFQIDQQQDRPTITILAYNTNCVIIVDQVSTLSLISDLWYDDYDWKYSIEGDWISMIEHFQDTNILT